jgi:hypothetical protein
MGQREIWLVYRIATASDAESSSDHKYQVSDLDIRRPIMLTYCDHEF